MAPTSVQSADVPTYYERQRRVCLLQRENMIGTRTQYARGNEFRQTCERDRSAIAHHRSTTQRTRECRGTRFRQLCRGCRCVAPTRSKMPSTPSGTAARISSEKLSPDSTNFARILPTHPLTLCRTRYSDRGDSVGVSQLQYRGSDATARPGYSPRSADLWVSDRAWCSDHARSGRDPVGNCCNWNTTPNCAETSLLGWTNAAWSLVSRFGADAVAGSGVRQ